MRRLCVVVALISASSCEGDDGEPSSTTMVATTVADPSTTGDASGTATAAASSTGESSTGAPLPNACEERSDCRLVSDCCTCAALHVDAEPAECDADCERTRCDDWGITEILCSHTCLIRLVECDATLVECADAPPECDEGFAPSVEARCWTRHCVPIELCTPS